MYVLYVCCLLVYLNVIISFFLIHNNLETGTDSFFSIFQEVKREREILVTLVACETFG